MRLVNRLPLTRLQDQAFRVKSLRLGVCLFDLKVQLYIWRSCIDTQLIMALNARLAPTFTRSTLYIFSRRRESFAAPRGFLRVRPEVLEMEMKEKIESRIALMKPSVTNWFKV